MSNAWVVCAPGDPTDAQWRAMREMSGPHPFCATQYNERSGWVRCDVSRPNGDTDTYTVSPNGRDVRWIGTEGANE